MSVYTGWITDLLEVAALPDTAANRSFLTAWHAHGNSACALNPIDLHATNSGSKRCERSIISRQWYQSYADPVWTRTAFAAQMEATEYAAVAYALKAGDPLGGDNHEALIEGIRHWGSGKFADFLAGNIAAGGPPVTLDAPHALGGWKDLRKSINRGMPDALTYSQRLSTATLRSLARTRKVRV